MLQTNLIFGIQKKIKEGKALTATGMLEENSGLDEVESSEVQLIMEGSLNAGIYQQTHKAKNKVELTKSLLTESFNLNKAQKKLSKDITFFNYLFENFTDEVSKDNFSVLLESLFEDTIRLYQECDVTPRLLSPALDSNELSESIQLDLYKNALNETIKNNYTKPMLSGKINELYESQIKSFTKQLIQENAEVDMASVRAYLPFEETINDFIKEVVMPETAKLRINAFMESTSAEYTDLLEESAEEILGKLEQKIKLLASLVSPNMFGKAVEAEGVDAPKMAGISITVDKNFGGGDEAGGGMCPAAVAAMDPEANEELEAEGEVEAVDGDDDIATVEADARDELGVASDSEDLELETAGNENSAAEETGSQPDQPGAIDMNLNPEDGVQDPENGMVTNDHDVALSGSGNDQGVLSSGVADLPGGIPADEGQMTEPDATDEAIEDMISSDGTELPEDSKKEIVENK